MLIANKIIETLSSSPFKTKDKAVQFTITASVGLSFFIDNEDTGVSVFKSADKALYKAKENGKNCVVLDNQDYVINKLGPLIKPG